MNKEKVCECCGSVFKKRERDSVKQWEGRRFCSKTCKDKSNTRTQINERFWSFVKTSSAGCWEWTGATDGRGYGQISTTRNGSPVKAHRLSWSIHFGDIPKGLNVCHACDNPKCVNPNHLMLGTQKANMVDASKKGRISEVSKSNLQPGSFGFYGAGPVSRKEIENGIR